MHSLWKMKKLFFFTVIDFANWQTDGICKKILSQVNVFEKKGYSVDLCFMINEDTYISNAGQRILLGKRKGLINKGTVCKYVSEYIKDKTYDAVYIRYGFAERNFYKLLKLFKKKSERILLEIATYPYDKEFENGFDRKVALFLDKCYRNRMSKYVDKVVTFSNDEYIFGIPTIKTVNGINFDELKMRNVKVGSDEINLIAVASMAPWHGYDRLLMGLGNYYKNGGYRKLKVHLVGDGDAMPTYREIVERYNIKDNVVFYGMKSGKELDLIYDECDMAVASLGLHRLNIYLASTLKTREYAAKGLPIITSSQIDIFSSETYPYLCRFSEDDTDIDVNKLISFYDSLYKGKDKKIISNEIRSYAQDICDMSATMKEILEFYEK